MSKLTTTALSVLLLASAAQAEDQALPETLFEADVVRLSAEHNPDLKAALLQLERANWDTRGLEARYAPVLQLDGSATQTENPNLSARFNTSGTAGTSGNTTPNVKAQGTITTNTIRRADLGAQLSKHTLWGTDLSLRVSSYALETVFSQSAVGMAAGTFGPGYGMSVKLALKQPLLRGRGRDVNEASLLASRQAREASQFTRDRVASEVLRDALTAYWELWYAGAALRIEEQAREVARKQREDAAARVGTGSLAPADVLAFETQVATREESLLQARVSLRQRELELLQKLGLVDAGALSSPRAESEPMASVPPRDEAVRRALAESAELKELISSLTLAALQQKTAADPQKARLDLDSYLQAQGLGYQDVGAAANQFGSLGAVSAFVGLTYEAPVNRTRERAEAAKARLATEVAQEQLRAGKQRITAQVALLHERSQAGESSVALAERTLDITRQQLAAEQARYASGASTSLQVLEAEDGVRSAELRVARARADFMQSVLGLNHLTGDLLVRYGAQRASR